MLKRVLMTLGLTATLAAPSGEGDALRNATLYFTRVELIASDEIRRSGF
jgi:hypothetical protein